MKKEKGEMNYKKFGYAMGALAFFLITFTTDHINYRCPTNYQHSKAHQELKVGKLEKSTKDSILSGFKTSSPDSLAYSHRNHFPKK